MFFFDFIYAFYIKNKKQTVVSIPLRQNLIQETTGQIGEAPQDDGTDKKQKQERGQESDNPQPEKPEEPNSSREIQQVEEQQVEKALPRPFEDIGK